MVTAEDVTRAAVALVGAAPRLAAMVVPAAIVKSSAVVVEAAAETGKSG